RIYSSALLRYSNLAHHDRSPTGSTTLKRQPGATVSLTPLEVITCATRTGAEIMGRGDEFGTVQPGKLADLLVVDGDVIADISVLEDRSRSPAVRQGGKIKAARLAKPIPTMVKREQ